MLFLKQKKELQKATPFSLNVLKRLLWGDKPPVVNLSTLVVIRGWGSR